jgi:hypothetical protein
MLIAVHLHLIVRNGISEFEDSMMPTAPTNRGTVDIFGIGKIATSLPDMTTNVDFLWLRVGVRDCDLVIEAARTPTIGG